MPGELTTTEALDLVDQLAEAGVLDVALSGGEPLLREDITHIAAAASAHGLQVAMGTNGLMLNTRVIESLKRAGVRRIQVSIDGPAEIHDAVRGVPGLFDRAVRAVADVRDAGVAAHVGFTPQAINFEHLPAVVELALDLGAELFNLSQFVPVGRGTKRMDLGPAQWRWVLETWSALRRCYEGRMRFTSHLAQLVLVEKELSGQPGFRGCQAGCGQCFITATGELTPCVLLHVPLGNLRSTRFRDLWSTSPAVRACRDRDRLKGRCRTCAYRDRCGGCRALAYAYTGDFLAEDPRCWLHAHPEAPSAGMTDTMK